MCLWVFLIVLIFIFLLLRFKDSSESTDWKEEKIVVGSDPVESIDNTNYIEETKNVDFPFHAHSVEPIIVEDSFTDEMTTLSERELPPLKIIDYWNANFWKLNCLIYIADYFNNL